MTQKAFPALALLLTKCKCLESFILPQFAINYTKRFRINDAAKFCCRCTFYTLLAILFLKTICFF